MRCTYLDCQAEGTIPQKDNDGSVWATLCEAHNAALDKAIVDRDAAAILRHWIRAQGGAKAAAERMMR